MYSFIYSILYQGSLVEATGAQEGGQRGQAELRAHLIEPEVLEVS
jgi:hypothetical protein